MNRAKKIKYMRKYILQYADINKEHSREPDKNYYPYRKGSYEVIVVTPLTSMIVGGVSKYEVYKTIYKHIKEERTDDRTIKES